MRMVSDIKRTLRVMLDAPARRRAQAQWREIRRASSVDPVVSFGGMLGEGKFVHGGAVKLLALREAFPSNEEEFNVLYLVSSAQPRFAKDLVAETARKGIPLVWNQNGVGYAGWAGADAERHNAVMRKLRTAAAIVIYQSEFCRMCAEQFLGRCNVRGEVLLNPVDLEKYHPMGAVSCLEPLRLLAMGTQNYRERTVAALECVRELRRRGIATELTIAGPLLWRDAREDLRRTAEAWGVGDVLHLRPPFQQEEAPEIYRAHHVLIHPKYLDPCPTVVAEALACGLPVVASRSGGLPEMTDQNCAELLDVPLVWDRMVTPSGGEFADAVERILGRLDEARRAARACAERLFDERRWVERHREIFESVRR